MARVRVKADLSQKIRGYLCLKSVFGITFMQPWLVAVFVLSVGAGIWWNLSDQNDQHDAIIDSSSTSAEPAAEKRDAGARETERLASEAPDLETTHAFDDANRHNDDSQETESEPPAVGGIDMPDSYPVTEAAKYYIPKEERKPGNLGGPPPLNFPGGSSDTN